MANTKQSNQIPAPEAASSSSVLPPPPWIELPGDVAANILQRLDAIERLESAQLVCTTWRKVCLNPAMWRVVKLVAPDSYFETANDYDLICRCVVDRSQGELTDLSIVRFGEDELLDYIADHSSRLQRLTIAYCNCFGISGTALSQAVKELPHLKELNLIFVHNISANDIEAIGVSCPMLNSFSYHLSDDPLRPGDERPPSLEIFCNQYALAIAKTMPNLRHLQLLANWMTNEGLEAILDGCPHLESLDIRQCSGLNLTGALAERCYEQIQNLRDPSEAISDLEWLGAGGESLDIPRFSGLNLTDALGERCYEQIQNLRDPSESIVKWSAECGNTSRSCQCDVCSRYYNDYEDDYPLTSHDFDYFGYESS